MFDRYLLYYFSSDNVMRIIDIVENLLVREISLTPNRSEKFSENWLFIDNHRGSRRTVRRWQNYCDFGS